MRTPLTIGSLFSGYGGLDLGVQSVLGGSTAWVSDVCKVTKSGVGHHDPHRGACAILAHRFPGVPNLGDITAVDWSTVEPVDVITGGSPCQDLSHAGKRAGMTEGTRSNLWVAMREAVAVLRPSLVVWENVRGAYSACADSEMGRCPRCVGEDPRGRHAPHLRALGRVLGDLADLGYDAAWHGVRASDVGAPHQRFRVFVVAYPASDAGRLVDDSQDAADAGGVRRQPGRSAVTGEAPSGRALGQPAGRGDEPLTLPTPTSRDHKPTGSAEGFARRIGHGQPLPEVVAHLLPTPADMGDRPWAREPGAWDAWVETQRAKGINGNGHGMSLSIEAQRLLPTPMVGSTSPAAHGQISGQYRPQMAEAFTRWGDYADAITRWESLTRPAPDPTMTSTKGTQQLSPAFAEWMMGLPAGWVTDVPGITRTEALKALGNGVVPQQAAEAVSFLLDALAHEGAA